jgi:hypothetical protein
MRRVDAVDAWESEKAEKRRNNWPAAMFKGVVLGSHERLRPPGMKYAF